MKKLRVCFIGGRTNGKIVLDYLNTNKYVNVPIVITYLHDYDVPRLTRLNTNDVENVIRDHNANDYIGKIKELKIDLIFVAGWSGLLSKQVLEIPPMGVIGFHPSKLPEDRGRSVLAWQIEEGYTKTALSMFYLDEIPDTGDIIAQEDIKIEKNDYINDLLGKIDSATYNLMYSYFPLIRRGIAPKKPQDRNDGNYRRLRKERDSLINWDQNSNVIYNKIRAISKPYPGAHFYQNGKKIIVWRSEIIEDYENDQEGDKCVPGTIMEKTDKNKYIIKCREEYLLISTESTIPNY